MCHKNIGLLRVPATRWILLFQQFPNCPIRLNRTPARNIYYKHIDYLCTFRSLIYIYIYLCLCHCSQVFLFLSLAAHQISIGI